MIESSPSVRIEEYYQSFSDMKISLKRSKIHAAFYFPKNFEINAKSNKQASVTFFKNSSNILLNNIVYEAGLTSLKTASAGILLKKIKSDFRTSKQAMFYANPIRIDTHTLFNPNYSYAFYLVPGFILFTLQMIILVTTVVSINREYNLDKFADILSYSNSSIKIILGKTAAYSTIHLFNDVIILIIILPFSNIRSMQIFPQLFLLLSIFTFANIAIGLMISSLVKNILFSTELIVFTNTPAFILSGYTFPLESMPNIYFYFAKLLPFTHLLSALVKTYQMNLGLNYILNEITLFIILSIISICLAVIFLYNSINKIKVNKYEFFNQN